MVLGLSLRTFTLIHVLISLCGISSGVVVIWGFLKNRYSAPWTAIFLSTTALTSITGFLFPFSRVTPGITLGVISLIILVIAVVALYPLRAEWPKTYIISASAALYLNFFVLVVQSFEKAPALRALAPTQKEPPFAIAQLLLLLTFVALTIVAVKRCRSSKLQA